MTYRLDRESPYETQMTGKVIGRTLYEQKPALILDRSLFYPTSGGQSADHGKLWPISDEGAAIEVVDVVAQGDSILHILSAPFPEKADEVAGLIDWRRRFDHMQQHTGQHVLSAALYRLCQAETKSSRLGAEVDTIDLGVELSASALQEAEELANQIVGEDRPVKVTYPSTEALAKMPLRKEPKVEDNIRVVEVDSFDFSPCGGTHVRSSSEIGLICVAGTERYKGGTRLTFLCGKRVISAFRAKRVEDEQLARLLSAPAGDQTKAVERLLEEAASQKAKVQELTSQLGHLKAKELLLSPEPVLRQILEGDRAMVKIVAQQISQAPKRAAFLGGVEEDKNGKRGFLFFAASPDSGIDAGARLKAVCAKVGGRGGGKPFIAEGSCPVEKLEEAIREA